MPFTIVRNDIVKMQVDVIVNTANPQPVVGGGTDTAIHTAAGPKLLEARKGIGHMDVADVALTSAYLLPARYVIHTVGPVWQGGNRGEEEQLRLCYQKSLQLAWEQDCRSIAFPLISTGTYRFPKDLAMQIALAVFSGFLMEHEMDIYLVVFHREAYQLSQNLLPGVKSYIDEHYVREKTREEYSMDCPRMDGPSLRARAIRPREMAMPCGEAAPQPSGLSLHEMLKNTDKGFAEKLLELMDATGEKDSAIYGRANVSRQHFSKIRNNPGYKPTKATAIAFAIALKLNLEQTKDLIGRAGYALTNSSKFDVIIMYFIQQKNYDMIQINMTLFEFDQPILGGNL